MLPVRRLLSVVSLFAALALPALLQAAATPSHVQASLVAADASVQAGKPVTVALRFVHDPHWHTYWLNPGTGLPTSIAWTLPPGWKAGDIQWPAPHVLKDSKGNVVGNGYEGELFLPVTLTPPADLKAGDRVELKAAADWLMCEDVCIPGSAKLTLTLPVSADAPKPDATWGDKIRATVAALPRALPEWKLSAAHDAKSVTLTVTPAQPGLPEPKAPHFFSEDSFVDYEKPQQFKSDGKGGFILTMVMAAEAEKTAKKLLGVVTTEGSWLPNATLRGMSVAADFSANALAGTASAGSPAPNAAPGSLVVTLAVAFLGGLILNLMPCVFPVIGIKILGFVNQAGHERGKIVAHALTFTFGVLLSFWILAGVLTALGPGRGWGYQLQIPGFNFTVAIVMLVFGMCLSGVFEFGLSATAVGGNLQMKSGYSGSFFSGVLATVVATPCSAPFLATALGATITLPAVQKFSVFTTIGLGLSTPYLLLSLFPAAVKILPRPGAWMETFKQFMAFPLYGTVAYLLWVLAAQAPEEAFRGVLFGLVLVAMGVWFYGRWNAPGASPGRARFGVAALVICGALGVWIGWPHRPEPVEQRDPAAPPAVVWEPWSPEAVAKLRAEGRIVYVDFTARWCATCQTNKKIVFRSDDVLRYFADQKIVTLRGDWTNQDPRITAELARYQRAAVPFNVIWMPGKDEPVILPEILTPGTVLDALKKG
jgi:thiol:disulfide interchange protein